MVVLESLATHIRMLLVLLALCVVLGIVKTCAGQCQGLLMIKYLCVM